MSAWPSPTLAGSRVVLFGGITNNSIANLTLDARISGTVTPAFSGSAIRQSAGADAVSTYVWQSRNTGGTVAAPKILNSGTAAAYVWGMAVEVTGDDNSRDSDIAVTYATGSGSAFTIGPTGLPDQGDVLFLAATGIPNVQPIALATGSAWSVVDQGGSGTPGLSAKATGLVAQISRSAASPVSVAETIPAGNTRQYAAAILNIPASTGGGGGGGTVPPGGYGGSPRSFPLGPPDMTGATTIPDPNPAVHWTLNLTNGVDYILNIPSQRSAGITITGGRNIYVPKLLMRLVAAGGAMFSFGGGDAGRIIHVEQCWLDPNGQQSDAFKSQSPSDQTILQVKVCRIEQLWGQSAGVHADLFQSSGGIKEFWCEDFTGVTNYDGFMLQREANVEQQTISFPISAGSVSGSDYVFTAAKHTFQAGDPVGVWGCSPSAYNGGFTVLSTGGGGTANASDYGADTGGGYANTLAVDPQNDNHVLVMGDVWGFRASEDGGLTFHGNSLGVGSGGGGGNFEGGRACAFSLRPTTSGVKLLGTGNDHGSDESGALYYSTMGSGVIHVLDGTHGFGQTGFGGTGPGSGPKGKARRPDGDMIVCDYQSGPDTEYIYTVTAKGVYRYVNAGADMTAVTGPTKIVDGTTLMPASTYFCGMCLFDSNHLAVVQWDFSAAGTLIPSHVFMVTSSSGNLGTASTGNITCTELTKPINHVYDIHKGQDGHFYAACGFDGVYEVALSGGTLTWTHIVTLDNQVASVDADSNRNLWVGQCAANATTLAKSPNMVAGHSWATIPRSGSNWLAPVYMTNRIGTREWQSGDTTTATGRTWWLVGAGPADFNAGSHSTPIIRVSPFNNNVVISCGAGGGYMTRNGGTQVSPAVHGLNGCEVNIVKTSSAGHVSAPDNDYVARNSTDAMLTCTKGTYSSTGNGVSLNVGAAASTTMTGADGQSYQFIQCSGTTPAQLKKNGSSIVTGDNNFAWAVVNANAMAVDTNGVVYIAQWSGVYVVRPSGGGGSPATFTVKKGDASPGTLTASGRVELMAFAYDVGSIHLNRVNVIGVHRPAPDDTEANQTIRFGARTAPDPNPTSPGTITGYTKQNEDTTPLNVDWWSGSLDASNWYATPGSQTLGNFVAPGSGTSTYSVARPVSHAAAGTVPIYLDWPNHPGVSGSTKLYQGAPPGGDYVIISGGLPIPTAAGTVPPGTAPAPVNTAAPVILPGAPTTTTTMKVSSLGTWSNTNTQTVWTVIYQNSLGGTASYVDVQTTSNLSHSQAGSVVLPPPLQAGYAYRLKVIADNGQPGTATSAASGVVTSITPVMLELDVE
jgi:hypothetical protein